MYVPTPVPTSASSAASLAVVGEMMNDRSGLWLITESRTGLLRDNIHSFSNRSKAAAEEMLLIADRGDRFWPTKAEYYAALSEIRTTSLQVSKAEVDLAVASVVKGSRLDNVSDREWVKQALAVLNKISRGK